MKIAICLYGQPRIYNSGYETIKKLVELNSEHEFHFFFHTWYDENMIGQYYSFSNYREINKNDLLIQPNVIENLIKLYSPKSYNYESPKQFDISEIIHEPMYKNASASFKPHINNVISNIYSKFAVSQLLKKYCDSNNYIYDLCISIRFDFLNKINLKITPLTVNFDRINIYNTYPRVYIADAFVISNYELFMKYSSAYENLKMIFKTHGLKPYLDYIGCGYGLCIETILTANICLYFKDISQVVCFNSHIPNFI